MTKKYIPIKDKTGFITVKNKPSFEELERHYNNHYFSDEKHRPLNYQENYDNDELNHINLMNDLFFYSYTVLQQHVQHLRLKINYFFYKF